MWRLSASPTVTIGGSAAPAHEFFRVRGAWRLSDGTLAVINSGTSEIRLFDRSGVFLRSIGRKGEGPGEFQQMGWTARNGDTAFVYDGSLRRLTTMALVGLPRVLGTLTVASTDDRELRVAGRLGDGRWLVRSESRPDVNLRDVQRLTGVVGLLPPSASGAVTWLAELPDMALFVYNPSPAQRMVSITVQAFSPGLVTLASGRTIWVGDTARDSLLAIDASSAIRRGIRLPDGAESLGGAVVDGARASELRGARTPRDTAAVELKYSARMLPPRRPSHESLVAGSGGEVWVERTRVSPTDSAQYAVLSANGVPIARIAGPSGFRVSDVGRDYVVGIHRDDDGVESVRVYALSR